MTWKRMDADFLNNDRNNRLVYLTPPHAPSIVSTIAPNGSVNVGSFEQTMLCSNNPPMILLAVSPKSDTLYNLRDTKECVIGFPYPSNLQELFDAGVRLPRGESELDYIPRLKPIDSRLVQPPRFEQCWFSAEGTLEWEKESGDHVTCCIAIKEVVVDEELWTEDRVQRRKNLPVSYYATAGEFYVDGAWRHVDMSAGVKQHKHAD